MLVIGEFLILRQQVMYKCISNFYRLNYINYTNGKRFYSNAIKCVQSRSFGTIKKMFKSSVFNLQEATKDQIQEFLNSFDTVLTDCDGMYSCSIPFFFNSYFRKTYL